MKTLIGKQNISLNTPVGRELVNHISSLVTVQIVLNENQDIDLNIGFNKSEVAEAVKQFLKKSIRSRTVKFDPTIEHALSINKSTGKINPSEQNNYGLTKREREIMDLLSKGKPEKEVASILGITKNTVKTHTKMIHIKYRATNRIEAILEYLIRNGRLIENSPDLILVMSQLGFIDSLN